MVGIRKNRYGGKRISRSKSTLNRCYVFESKTSEEKSYPDGLRIRPLSTRKELKIFYEVPFQIYKNNPYWVAPFWKEMNGFFSTKNRFWSHADGMFFIAWKQHKAIGRIAAIIDYAFCEKMKKNIGYFGFFECIDDFRCASALLQTAQDWLASKEMDTMRGPIDGRVDVGCGFLYNGFESPPKILSSYTPAYYVTFAERFGLQKARDLFLYHIDLTKPLSKELQEKARVCIEAGVLVRPFNRMHTKRELAWWIDLFLETFSDHWGFVPVSSEEVKTRFGVKQIRWFVDSALFLVAEIDGSPVAYLWSTPDYNEIFRKMNGRLGPFEVLQYLLKKRTIKNGKLHLIGISRKFRNKNIASLLNYNILQEMQNRGYAGAEIGWIDEQNVTAHATMATTGAKLYKKHRVYEKNLRA